MIVKTVFSGFGGQGVLMMGAFMKVTGLVPADIYLNSLEMVMGSKKKAVIEINRKAFAAGYEYLK